ncbi:hypothetical protein A79_4548 [Vibrio parahaemolyticus AQ3810]|nr:hypothetical protein A79_4548 [Vibrio parahaemolyticus AQ3810]
MITTPLLALLEPLSEPPQPVRAIATDAANKLTLFIIHLSLFVSE